MAPPASRAVVRSQYSKHTRRATRNIVNGVEKYVGEWGCGWIPPCFHCVSDQWQRVSCQTAMASRAASYVVVWFHTGLSCVKGLPLVELRVARVGRECTPAIDTILTPGCGGHRGAGAEAGGGGLMQLVGEDAGLEREEEMWWGPVAWHSRSPRCSDCTLKLGMALELVRFWVCVGEAECVYLTGETHSEVS